MEFKKISFALVIVLAGSLAACAPWTQASPATLSPTRDGLVPTPLQPSTEVPEPPGKLQHTPTMAEKPGQLPGQDLDDGCSPVERLPTDSAEAQQIVFVSDRSGYPQLYRMNSDGSNLEALTDGSGQNTEPKWSPDGRWIAYHCSREGEIRICVVSPDGQLAGEPISGTTPVWAPGEDETRLAFICFQDNQSDICTVRPDGSQRANLTKSPAGEHTPAWSPDGNWIAFVSNRGSDIDVYKVCLTCRGEPAVVRLTDEPRAASWPAWSPDGSQLAYVVGEAGQDLMLVNADRSDAAYLASGVFGTPVWLP